MRTIHFIGAFLSLLGGANAAEGVQYIVFNRAPGQAVKALRLFFDVAEQTSTPIVVQIDTEHWWDARPDLWNWWDSKKPGFDSGNRENVEWTGWSSEQAIKIAWRNWEKQVRVLPQPNLASPRYVEACKAELRRLVPMVLESGGRVVSATSGMNFTQRTVRRPPSLRFFHEL